MVLQVGRGTFHFILIFNILRRLMQKPLQQAMLIVNFLQIAPILLRVYYICSMFKSSPSTADVVPYSMWRDIYYFSKPS
jgi:hypothetical protein